MTHIDRQTFFSALGFVTVLLQEENKDTGTALHRHAEAMSGLIEEFCSDKAIGTPSPSQEKAPAQVVWLLDQIIGSLKTQMKAGQAVELPAGRELKLELLRTLQDRQSLYVMDAQRGDDLLDAAIMQLLQAEIQNIKSEAQMMITHVQGDPNAFAPYQYLATTIANIIREKGKCSKQDVISKGFSNGELENWNMAYALAQVDLMEG